MRSACSYIPIIIIGFIILEASRAHAQQKKGTEQVDALLKEKNERTPVERKIDSRLLQAIKERSGKKLAEGEQLEPADVRAGKSGNLLVDISATVTDELLEKIKALGGQIIFPSKQYNTIRAQINLSMVEKIASYEEVKFIRAAVIPILSGGAARSKTVVH